MPMRVRVITTLTICFALFFPNTIYAANPKAGATCSKAGMTQTYKGKKFTCIKSGKKLFWDRGVTVRTTPSPAPSPTITSKFDEENIIVGDQCSSEYRGKTIINSKGAFICKHDEISAYRWYIAAPSKITETPTPTQTPVAVFDWTKTYSTDLGYFHNFNGACQYEENVSPQFKDLQIAYYNSRKCSGIYDIAKYELGKARPNSILKIERQLPVDQCKIAEPNNAMALRGFYSKWDSNRIAWTTNHKIPRSKMTIQLIPIFADDTARPLNSPEQDYGKYLNVLKNWVEYSSDAPSSVQIKVPEKYIKFNGSVGSYGIYHEKRDYSPEHKKFNKDLVAQVDPNIDFSGIDAAIIVVPAGTELSVFQQGTIGELNTNEGIVYVSTTEYPYTLTNLESVKFSNFLIPFWWIHELFHSGIGFPDHYGDGQSNINTDYGLGWWTLLTPWGGDLSAWEKWVLGFYTDSQINCLEKDSSNTVWLAPSSVRTSEKKLTIVPISEYKAIAIESIRPAGLYYKISKNSQGVLVYEIDLTKTNYDSGLTLVLPTNRNPNQPPTFLSQATLRPGESVVSNGQRITVLESGNFGDVVKVEKA
jgi:M6 family metalloprotease-like protein